MGINVKAGLAAVAVTLAFCFYASLFIIFSPIPILFGTLIVNIFIIAFIEVKESLQRKEKKSNDNVRNLVESFRSKENSDGIS